MNRLVILFLLSIAVSAASAADKPAAPPETAALNFIISAFVERDADKAVKHIADNASRKGRAYEKGKLREGLRREIKRLPPREQLTIQQIRFFRKDDVTKLQKEFSQESLRRFGWDRVSKHIGDGLGCLVVLSVKEDLALLGFVFKEVNGRHLIVYTDDD